jgi:homoserine kinase
MIGESAQTVAGGLETDFDFEAESVERDDIDGLERQVRGHEDDVAAAGVGNEDKADEALSGPPEEIERAIGNLLVALTIDRTGDCSEERKVLEDGVEVDLFAIELGSASGAGGG